jgi:hypothetical protein
MLWGAAKYLTEEKLTFEMALLPSLLAANRKIDLNWMVAENAQY